MPTNLADPVSNPALSAASLADAAHALLRSLKSPLIESYLKEWPGERSAMRAPTTHSVPVTRYLPHLAPPDFCRDFVVELAAVADQLCWRQSYGAQRAGNLFMENYGYSELLGLSGVITSARLALGVLLLGPATEYAAHWHEAEELYVPLSGAARWWQGVQAWRTYEPGAVIHHTPFEPHAMRTAQAPLLALYLWRSDDLAQSSNLVCASACEEGVHHLSRKSAVI